MTLVWVFFSRVTQREVVIRVDDVLGYHVWPNGTRVATVMLHRAHGLAVAPLRQLVVVP